MVVGGYATSRRGWVRGRWFLSLLRGYNNVGMFLIIEKWLILT